MRVRQHVVVLATILTAACALSAKPPGPPPPVKVVSDAELERAIRERLARSRCAVDKFTVRVQGGVATLEGKTDVMQRKGAATRMAKSAGARKVVNRIEISEAARQKASDRLAKGRRRVQVKRGEARQHQTGRE